MVGVSQRVVAPDEGANVFDKCQMVTAWTFARNPGAPFRLLAEWDFLLATKIFYNHQHTAPFKLTHLEKARGEAPKSTTSGYPLVPKLRFGNGIVRETPFQVGVSVDQIKDKTEFLTQLGSQIEI